MKTIGPTDHWTAGPGPPDQQTIGPPDPDQQTIGPPDPDQQTIGPPDPDQQTIGPPDHRTNRPPSAPLTSPSAPLASPSVPLASPFAPLASPSAPLVSPSAPLISPSAPLLLQRGPEAQQLVLAERVWAAMDSLGEQNTAIILQWVPGHADIAGNEAADRLANRAAAECAQSETPIDLASARTAIRKRAREMQATQSELGVYKSVPPPRQLGDQPVTNGAAPGRLSGSDPMLANQEIQLHSSKFPVSDDRGRSGKPSRQGVTQFVSNCS
ncbi:DNA-directed RNA polymerase II subunit RPB1 [Amphibalanus amphitrite]|uniref:DNA-directed RNA polymerase II subunit RPB1 n=1 Tax=Amphibalanus amphitrite TaxID=1232801 RepID=A0A6A4XGY7_AMPAM|nr:DNA-directed RNA polymerase II subunit RPB1 [Amphibalanus amphitrite]